MGNFTIGKDIDNGKTAKYINPNDLIRVVHYCMNPAKCIYYKIGNLYPLGVDCFIDQMLYLQNYREKPISTRVVHYILNIALWEIPGENKLDQVKSFVNYMSLKYFVEYQTLWCLHTDKDGRYDIHILINPVNLHTYGLYHCSPSDFEILQRTMAEEVYCFMGIALQATSYISSSGKLRMGKNESIYLDDRYYDC